MKLYHGTKSQFTHFSIPGDGKHGVGYYLTKDYREAKSFSTSLAGNGEGLQPRVLEVEARVNNLFDTLSQAHAEAVMRSLGVLYKAPKQVGSYGADEHYNHLKKQLKALGHTNPNEVIRNAGFDGIFWAFCDHVIVFDESALEIVSVELIEV